MPRRSDPPQSALPPQSIPDADVVSARPSKSFWEVPSVRSSRSLIPSAPPPPERTAALPPPAPPLAAERLALPPPPKPEVSTVVEAPVMAATAPSTLAPAAYDTVSESDDAPILKDDELLDPTVGDARSGFFSRVGARAALGGVVVLLGLWLVLRARHSTPPVDAPHADLGAQAQAAPAANAILPDLPDEPDEPAASPAAVDDATALELQRRARELLSSGQIVEGVAYARRAIAARPLDSDNYILLAAGLQDLGQWQQARMIFSQCVRRSGGPATVECQYFANQGN
jgi:hypothetical protein